MRLRIQAEASSGVLVVEDDNLQRISYFRERLPQATIVRHPMIAIQALEARAFEVIFLDHDLPCPEYTNGLDVAQHLASTGFTGRAVIHSANIFGASRIEEVLDRAGIRFMRAEFGTFSINEPEPNVIDLGSLD